MPGFLKGAAIVMSGGTIVGVAVLAILPEDESLPSSPAPATLQIPGTLRAQCARPLWPSTDRTCLTWPVPQPDMETALSTPPALARDTRVAADRPMAKARTHPSRAASAKAKVGTARRENISPPVAYRWAEGSQRGFMTWQTPRQDAFQWGNPERRGGRSPTFAWFGTPAR